MSDSAGPSTVWPASEAHSAAFAGRARSSEFAGPAALALLCCAAVINLCTQAAVAGANNAHAAGISYLCLSMVMAGCGLSFFVGVRQTTGVLRTRWLMVAAGSFAASTGYAVSFSELILHTAPARVFQVSCFNASEALYLMAMVLFFAGVTRAIVIVDMLQALLFILLRFNLVYSPSNDGHFTLNHLIVGQCMALFLFLIAMVASMGASSRGEARFLRTLACFFGFRLVGFFLSNQVSYTWLHYQYCSLFDMAITTLLTGFALFVLYTRLAPARRASASHAADAEPCTPSVTVSSLMPSFLALVNLILGLFLLRISVPLAAVAMSLSLVCYVVRTVLLQSQAMTDKALLETRYVHLEGLARRDSLTGIGNRRSLADAYSRLQDAAGGKALSVLLMDIDQFKQANDCHGHLHGDQVLIRLARMLEAVAGRVASSHCARLGGDEFALLLPQTTPQAAAALAEELRVGFSAQRFEMESSRVSLSIGIASLNAAHDLPLETLVRSADEALYRAKQRGRDRVETLTPREPATGPAANAARLELQQIAG